MKLDTKPSKVMEVARLRSIIQRLRRQYGESEAMAILAAAVGAELSQ